jgi:membrane protein YqaA with SNARE-associated domain
MSVWWLVVASAAPSVLAGAVAGWWLNRPTGDLYATAVRQHEAFERYVQALVDGYAEQAELRRLRRRLAARIRELDDSGGTTP